MPVTYKNKGFVLNNCAFYDLISFGCLAIMNEYVVYRLKLNRGEECVLTNIS